MFQRELLSFLQIIQDPEDSSGPASCKNDSYSTLASLQASDPYGLTYYKENGPVCHFNDAIHDSSETTIVCF